MTPDRSWMLHALAWSLAAVALVAILTLIW
jgi:hypothetical protein